MTRTITFAALLSLSAHQACAFIGTPSFVKPYTSTALPPVPLRAMIDGSDMDTSSTSPFRRHVAFQISLAAAATMVSIVPKSNAEEEQGGKLIEFTVNNLDGEQGSTGSFIVRTHPEWAPIGVERFEALVDSSFFEGCRIFRVLPGFVSQFGINGNPSVQAKWRSQNLRDDPVRVSNKRGTVVFATAGPNSRTTQLFINLSDRNSFLDNQGFSPVAEVVSGMDVVERFYSGYGEGAPSGKGPNQLFMQAKGNEYLESSYPKLSYFSKVSLK